MMYSRQTHRSQRAARSIRRAGLTTHPRKLPGGPPLQSLGTQLQAERLGVNAPGGQPPQVDGQLPGHRNNDLFFAGAAQVGVQQSRGPLDDGLPAY